MRKAHKRKTYRTVVATQKSRKGKNNGNRRKKGGENDAIA